MTKRQENAQETRRKIYSTACSLIEEKGFANVSVEDITRACGVAKGTFYVYFRRKEEIIFECCKEWFSDVDRKAREHKGTIAEKLRSTSRASWRALRAAAWSFAASGCAR